MSITVIDDEGPMVPMDDETIKRIQTLAGSLQGHISRPEPHTFISFEMPARRRATIDGFVHHDVHFTIEDEERIAADKACRAAREALKTPKNPEEFVAGTEGRLVFLVAENTRVRSENERLQREVALLKAELATRDQQNTTDALFE